MVLGLDWLTAFIKISFQIVFAIVTAIPFYFAWNAVASTYFKFLPEVWWKVPFWDIVAILLCAKFVGEIINNLTPKIISISQDNTNNSGK